MAGLGGLDKTIQTSARFSDGLSDKDVDWMDDPNVDSEDAGLGGSRAWEHDYPGFSRNPLFVSMFCF